MGKFTISRHSHLSYGALGQALGHAMPCVALRCLAFLCDALPCPATINVTIWVWLINWYYCMCFFYDQHQMIRIGVNFHHDSHLGNILVSLEDDIHMFYWTDFGSSCSTGTACTISDLSPLFGNATNTVLEFCRDCMQKLNSKLFDGLANLTKDFNNMVFQK